MVLQVKHKFPVLWDMVVKKLYKRNACKQFVSTQPQETFMSETSQWLTGDKISSVPIYMLGRIKPESKTIKSPQGFLIMNNPFHNI